MMQGIVALPMHDCINVAESEEGKTAGIMRPALEEYTGQPAGLLSSLRRIPG
jgi:hypothetical protein